MVVAFTPNIGLAKPDESELANNWAENTQLCDDNNQIIIAKTNIVQATYTPTFICTTTNPNVGVGYVSGEYTEVQGFIFGTFAVKFTNPGTGAGTGTGAYGISLPFPADGAFHNVGTTLSDSPGTASCIGEGLTIDNTVANGGTFAVDVVTVAGVSYARMISETYPGKAAAFINPGNPVTYTDGDMFTANFFYKKA